MWLTIKHLAVVTDTLHTFSIEICATQSEKGRSLQL